MDIDRNSTDGARAMDEETLRHLEQDLVQNNPSLRFHSSKSLREMALAIQRGSEAGWQPSEATRGDGQMQDSDVNKQDMQGFFGNMEAFRQREMVPPETLGPTDDPSDERYFAEERTSPGQQWLQHIQNPNQPELGGPVEENQPKQAEPEAAQSKPTPWLRHYPAAGRFGARRSR